MRSAALPRGAAFLSLLAVAAVASAPACGSSAPEAGPEDAADAATTNDSASGPTRPEPKAAVGDPCRGIPLPTDQHFVAPGLCARLVATGVDSLRQITFAPSGDLYGTTAAGSIKRFHDEDGDGYFRASEIKEFANTNGNGNNAHIDVAGGYVYAGSDEGVKRFPFSDTATSVAGEDVVVGQPRTGHSKHTVHVYDGYLYVHSGSEGNATNPKSPAYDDDRSLVRRFALASFTPGTPMQWLSGEVFTSGLRNMNGFTKSPTGKMYGVVNGLDGVYYENEDVHDDNPGEQIVELSLGNRFGYPFCFTAQRVIKNGAVVPPGTQLFNQGFATHDDAWCAANSMKPTTFVQAHAAPLDLVFFGDDPKGVLPETWRGGAFVALHGSWNRTTPTGYKVVWIPFDADGKSPMPTSTMTTTTFPHTTVFGGGSAGAEQDGAWSWSEGESHDEPRPAGVAISPIDGALYIASDSGGTLYRVGLTSASK